MKITSVALPDELTDRIDRVARDSERSRSFVVRKLLEQSLTGADRLAALEAISAEGLREYDANSKRERAPNASEIMAESSTEGHERLATMQRIDQANRGKLK